jgi:hypothetical protein
MYQIFCHELEDMGNSLFTYFLVFFSFFLVFSFLYFCLLVVVDHLLFDLLSTSSSGKPFFFVYFYFELWNFGPGGLSYPTGRNTRDSVRSRRYRLMGSRLLTEAH